MVLAGIEGSAIINSLLVAKGILIGLFLGSFTVNLGHRLADHFFGRLSQRRRPIWQVFAEGSHCTECKQRVAWYDLVPVFSWFILAGRCRHCQSRIPLFYPMVEAIWGIIGWRLAVMFIVGEISVLCIFLVVIILILSSWLAIIDYLTLHIPDAILIALFLLLAPFWVVNVVMADFQHIESMLLTRGTGVILTLPFLLLYFLMPGKMGFGDVKFIFVLGLMLNIPESIFSIMAASGFGIAYVVISHFSSGKPIRRIRIALVTCLVLAALPAPWLVSKIVMW